MKRYIFKEQEIINEYQYIFLCGSQYKGNNKNDKRNVLREFLKMQNINYRPIILEDNFIFKKNETRFLLYDDVYMKDLYQVEMLMNYLSDKNIIIHESISTGAETGLFLSEQQSLSKTCLLFPDEYAIEENKLGQFIRLAFLREPKIVKVIKFYPKVVKNILSNDVMHWHTYFWENRIGASVGNEIVKFLEKKNLSYKIKFVKCKKQVDEGFIHYRNKNDILEITLLPRVLINCVAAIFNIEEVSKTIFSGKPKELKEYINYIKCYLSNVFIQTVEEITGDSFKSCSIHVKMNIKDVYISGVIGMILYLFQAAGFISILKDDYIKTNKVKITRKMIAYNDGTKHFFYEKYKDYIEFAIDTQIV